MNTSLEKIVSLCKRRGFIYPGSAIYGGLANTWDFGPLGVELKNNIRDLWWQKFVKSRDDIYGLDGGIIMHPRVWEASGHLTNFTDSLVECKDCHKRFRADQISDLKKCAECGGQLTEPKKFNGMFRTFLGAAEDSSSVAYLRPETAQAIFVNFRNIVDCFHPKLPFGIAQYGKSFRNEITAGNFIFRDVEFEQMEIEYFVDPSSDWSAVFVAWQKEMGEWLAAVGIDASRLHTREHSADERSHYSKKTVDIEYDFPFGTKELYGLAYRTDYDLKQHQTFSGVDLSFKLEDGQNIIPHVIEPSFGMPRTLLAILLEAYQEEEVKVGDVRVVLKLKPQLAPYKAAVFPLMANKPEIVAKAREIYANLKPDLMVTFDDNGNVGKRYRRQDEIGTPWCVTVDYTTLEDNTVTVRDRDTMRQERLKIDELGAYFKHKLS